MLCEKKSFGWKWTGWVVASSLYLFDMFLRMSIDVVTMHLQEDFDVSASVVTGAFSSSFFYPYAVLQLPIGLTLDFVGPRATICASSLLCTVGCIMFAFAPSVPIATIARVISGVGCGCGWLGVVKVMRNSFGAKETPLVATVFGVTCMLGGLGALASQAPFQLLVSHLGWRYAYAVCALWPLLTSVGAFMFIGDLPQMTEENVDAIYQSLAKSAWDDEAGKGNSSDAVSPLGDGYRALPGGDRDDCGTGSLDPPAPSTCRLFGKALVTPRLWLYAIYLGGTDAPYETFVGLWGVAFLRQVFGWKESLAAVATMACVIVATVTQLLAGPLLSCMKGLRVKFTALHILALTGVVSLLPFVLYPYVNVSDSVGFSGTVAMGISVGSVTIIWDIISSDPLCDGNTSTGLISGMVNSLVIGLDAVMQQGVGAVLSARWDGKRDAENSPVYSPETYSFAFLVLLGCFVAAALSALLAMIPVLHRPPKASRVESVGSLESTGQDDLGCTHTATTD